MNATKKIFYGFGGLGYSVIGQTISNFFMFFATSVLGLSGTLVGITIAISTVWDGISDTIVGYFSDRKPFGKMGKRNGFMLVATIGMSVFNILLWSIPSGIDDVWKFIWILVALLLLETFNTMFATPYSALGNELAVDATDRTKINAVSTIFTLIGVIVPSILLVLFLPNSEEYPIGQLNPKGYINIAVVTSIICITFGLLCSLLTIPENVQQNKDVKSYAKFSIKTMFGTFLKPFKHKKLSPVILGYVLTSTATVFLCGVGLHFFTYCFFYTSSQITTLLLSLMLGTMLSQPLWVVVSKKQKKKPALILGIMLTIVAVFAIIFVYLFRIDLYKISFFLMIGLMFICGIGSGALYSLPTAIYGDITSKVCKENNYGSFSGALTFSSNIANSITQLLIGVLLDLIRFDSGLEVQSLGVQTGIALILFLGVEISLIVSCTIFSSVKEPKDIR